MGFFDDLADVIAGHETHDQAKARQEAEAYAQQQMGLLEQQTEAVTTALAEPVLTPAEQSFVDLEQDQASKAQEHFANELKAAGIVSEQEAQQLAGLQTEQSKDIKNVAIIGLLIAGYLIWK